MPPWLKLSRVRNVQVLGNQQSFFQLASSPDPFIRTTDQSLIDNGMDVMSDRSEFVFERRRNVLVEFEFQSRVGTGSSGRSSFAVAAANATTARS